MKPMGITDIEWLESPEGNTVGGWGLYLKTPDIAKIAILLANMGKWNGKTLIPEEYLKEATRKQIDTPEEKYPVCGTDISIGSLLIIPSAFMELSEM